MNARVVRLRERAVPIGPFTMVRWEVIRAGTGKSSRTPIGPVHTSRVNAQEWARSHGYVVLGAQATNREDGTQ